MSTTPKVIDKGNGVRIIDPNPEFHTIEHEDLYVYASLVAKTKGKSFLTEKETGDFDLDNVNVSSVDMAVQDSYQEKNPKDGGTIKRQFLTTNWTEIGGSQTKGGETADAGDLEGFGITNIDIEIKGSYIPKVIVDFVDIRGATLFEQGSCSPYGLFFHLPYPVFELTLKGYYGKPVTYYLNLVKFNTKFNAATGNFECRGEFIGWSYAFLADILMGYVRCSGYMDKWGAQDKLREKYDNTIKYYLDNGIYDETDYLPYYEPNAGQVYVEGTNPPNTIVQPFCSKVVGDIIQCMTIDELLLRIKDVKSFLADAKSDNDYIEVGGLLKVRGHLVKMQDKIRKFARLLEEDHKNKIKNGGPELTEVQNRNLRERYVFNSAPDQELKEFLKSYWSRPIDGNDNSGFSEITSYVPQAKEQLILDDGVTKVCGGAYVAVLSSFNRSNGLTGCQAYSTDDSDLYYEVLDFLDKDTTRYKFQKGMMTDGNFGLNYTDVTNNSSDDFYIDLGFPLDAINKNIEALDEQIETKRNFVKDSIDKGVVRSLGFRPTIRNIFTILSCNVENFIELLLDCSIQAEEEHNTEGNKQGYNDRYGENGSSQDDKLLEAQGRGGNNEDLKTIYPWPTYYQTRYRSAASANANDKSTETKEVYPGVNPDFFDWPEVRFVEDFIEACQKSNDVDELLKEDKTGLPGFDNYVPINPLESKLMDPNIECKYRGDLRSNVKEEVIDDVTLKNIAERMFVTLDFSYFDPIRYNPNNIGLGFSFTYRKDTGKDEPIDLKDYQNERLWMSTLYKSTTLKAVKNLAQIDAHNLFSCITETEKLSKINLKIGSGDLFSKVQTLLTQETDNITQVDANSSRGWFNPNATTKMVYRGNGPGGIDSDFIDTNMKISSIYSNQWIDDYWAYQPTGGYITFPGLGSDGRLGDPEEPDSAIRIYSDIREMKSEYLFRLYTQNEIDNIFQINLDGGGSDENSPLFKIKERRDELNEELSKSINDSKSLDESTNIEMKTYGLDSKTLLQTHNNEGNNDGLRLFTTLSIGDTSQAGYSSFNIEYAMTPFYLTNYNPKTGTRLLAGAFGGGSFQYNSFPIYVPFQMQSYKVSAADDNDFDDEGASNDMYSLLPFYGQTMEVPGRGILEDVKFISFNGDNEATSTSGLKGKSPSTLKADYKSPSTTFDAYGEWSAFDTFIQTPLWLDNVNRFRYAAARTNNPDGPSNRYVTSPKMTTTDWGSNRPLTSNEFVSPKMNVVKTAYIDGDRKNENDITGRVYSNEQIELRNLAYLFLSSCKTTPFITCGNTTLTTEDVDDENKIFTTDKADHYPKALVPFVTSQGLVKIPKIWVYGIGAVMWRWKNYMGLSDVDGNLRWRHPSFKETPSGNDVLAQPGHPSVACESGSGKEPMQGAGKINGAGRTNRSTTINGSTITNATTSYANKLFVGSGLWPSAPVGSGVPQRSSFAASTLRDRGWIKAIFYGLNYSDLNSDVPDNVQTQYIDKYKEMYPTTYGASFDYWGVYNNDSFLRTTKPQSLPFNSRRIYYEKNTFSSDTPINNSEGAWTSWWYEFSENGDNSPGAFSDLTIADDIGDETEDGSFSDPEPLWNQMRSAKEAAAHSYMPMLWVAPWQHFYTEAVSIDGSKSARKSGAAPTQGAYGTWVEQVLTFIPMDTPYRDYVGNFGLLGNENNNYSSRKVNAQTISLNLPIAASFTRKTFNGYYNGDKTVSQLLTSFYIKKGDKDGNTIKNTYMMTLEGGKYADLMAILPTFVKEKFVEEFEQWCDGFWKTKYLPVIDPVNFGWEVSSSSTNVPVPNAPYLKQGEHSYAEIDLLGKSYRAKPFGGDGASTGGIAKWPLSDIIGTYMGDEWTDSAESAIGFNHYCSLIALDKGNSENGKNGTIAELEKSLISEYYYAMISTPRLFGLDHPNGDYGGYNSDGSDYQYWDATSRPAYSNNAFYANKKLAKVYLEAFQEEWKEYYQTKFSQLTDEEGEDDNGSILNDDDIKLSLYRSFKSIVDKWISSTRRAKTGEKKLFFNITQNENDAAFDKSTTPLAGHFSYVNRVMGEIGNKAVLDVIKLDQIPENPKKSFYHTISDLLGENKFDFFPLPSFTNFTNNNRDNDINKTAREMFEPYTGTIVKASGPQFICMYVGGTSRMVDLRTKGGNCKIDQEDLSFNDDGFEISDETDGQRPPEYAKPMSEEPLAPFNPQYNYKDPTRIEGNGFTAFRVAYGIENQNMFKNIELDQTEFSETNESLMVIDRLAKGGDPSDRTQKGNNLHNVYLTRGYTAKVESLGNMTIQPLQYFELTNIPMFYGTYLITEVSHNIKPNHITTNFKGTRQPIATVPVVEDVATAMNQSLQKIDPSGKKRNALNGGFDAGGGPGDGCYNPNSTNNTITNNVPNNVVEGIPFIDVGKDDPSKYYNHAWKVCSGCDRNKPGQLNKQYKKDGTVKKTWWVAYNQPTSNLDPNKVEYIGLHWTGGYSKVKDSGTLKFRGLHYTFEIDKDGTLYQVSDLNKVAYHGGNMNSYSIGISYVGGTEDNKAGDPYVRTINDWNQEDLNLNGRDTYKAKKQFASIVDACTLAVKKYPNIKYITSHHFWSGSKSDVGNKFPYDILIAELKKRGINLTVKYSGDAPKGVKWTGKQQETVSGTINDLSYDRDAIQEETDGNEPEADNNNVATNNNSTLGTAVAGNINRPKNVNEALQSAGQI